MDALPLSRDSSSGIEPFTRNSNSDFDSITLNYDSGSFRDRTSRVFVNEGAVYRTLNSRAQLAWRRVSRIAFYERMSASGQIIETQEVSSEACQRFAVSKEVVGVLRHAKIPFISYPYEWSFAMLREAALLHLKILSESVPSGMILKDASPFNVQFLGTRPVFIDVGSFVDLNPGEPWSAYRQFCEMMLFPLLLQAYRGVHFQPILRGQLEGVSAKQFLQWIRWRDLLKPGVFTNGWLQATLERKTQALPSSTIRELQSSGFDKSLIERMLAKLSRLVERLEWKPEPTQWARYDSSLPHVADDASTKSDFVRTVCQSRRRELVWDFGCNEGWYSKIAARSATTVVAMDQDHGCVERLYRSLDPTQTNILPLCIDLANASPALGWRGRERKRLEDRGKPDLVLCLGLIHHLVFAANIPLPDVIDWLASLGGELILEFPSKKDSMVRSLLRNKHDQYDEYTLECLESELLKHYEIQSKVSLPSGERTLFHAIPNALSGGAI